MSHENRNCVIKRLSIAILFGRCNDRIMLRRVYREKKRKKTVTVQRQRLAYDFFRHELTAVALKKISHVYRLKLNAVVLNARVLRIIIFLIFIAGSSGTPTFRFFNE